MAEIALRPRDALYDALDLGERISRLARATSLYVNDGRVVLNFAGKTENEARADTELALLIELGEDWAATVQLDGDTG